MVSTETKTELHIRDLDLKVDSGQYICNGTSAEGSKQAVITLRVRSHLAALWPFLGIVAEVLVLVTIIFIYEKRRKPDEVLDGERPSDLCASAVGGPRAWHHPGVQDRRGHFVVEGQPLGWGAGEFCLPA